MLTCKNPGSVASIVLFPSTCSELSFLSRVLLKSVLKAILKKFREGKNKKVFRVEKEQGEMTKKEDIIKDINKDTNKDIIKDTNKLHFNVMPPVDLPGPFLMDIKLNEEMNLNEHSSAIDDDFKFIYEDPLNIINILEEMNGLQDNLTENTSNTQLFKKEEIIDKDYYSKQNERSEVFLRYAQADRLKHIFNFTTFLDQSFRLVNEPDEEVVEEYELVPSKEDDFLMIAGESEAFNEFAFSNALDETGTNSSVVNKITVKGRTYNLTQQNAEKYLCVNIKGGKSYFSMMSKMYKISK